MSKLDDLLSELCPMGVDIVTFGSVCEYIRGITYNKTQEAKPNDNNALKVLRANNISLKTNTLNFDDVKLVSHEVKVREDQYLYKNDILICAGSGSADHIGKVAYVSKDIDYTFGGFMAVVRSKEGTNNRFIFHVLTSSYFSKHLETSLNSSTINNLNASIMNNFRFPLPPLPIQQEIVRILDTFTNLQAELEAELEARKKQYSFYREELLNLPGYESKSISKIAHTNIGLATSVTQHKRDTGVQLIHNSDIQRNKIVLKSIEYISEEFAMKNQKKLLKEGDIITVHTGDVGTSAVVGKDYAGAIGFTTITTRVNDITQVLPRYLCHYLNSQHSKREVVSMTISDRSNLNQKSFETLHIPIPPIAEQKRIVDILDRFDILCDNYNSGIPAEIEVRRKQYEYYRNKLLTFKEKVS